MGELNLADKSFDISKVEVWEAYRTWRDRDPAAQRGGGNPVGCCVNSHGQRCQLRPDSVMQGTAQAAALLPNGSKQVGA